MRKIPPYKIAVLAALFCVQGLLFSRPAQAADNQACMDCHGGKGSGAPFVDPARMGGSIHGGLACNSCHMDIEGYPHPEKKTKPVFYGACHGAHDINLARNSASRINAVRVPQTCGRCHARELALYSSSVHSKQAARGHKEAPVCTSCHGEHTITAHGESGSSVFSGSVVKTCSHCHSSEKVTAKFGLPINPVNSYMDSYHGVAFRAGNLTAANCASCHRYHDVLAPSDPNSSVNPANLRKTCGSCHKKAGELVSKGKIHPDLSRPQPVGSYEWVLAMVRKMYILLIVLTLGGMILHNLLDLYRKGVSGWHSHPDELRMSVNERIQHAFLALSFIGLAYTGFDHRYPDSLFNTIFFSGSDGAALRTLLHRVFGGLFMTLAVYHAPGAFHGSHPRLPGHFGLAFLLDRLRPRRLSYELGLADRESGPAGKRDEG